MFLFLDSITYIENYGIVCDIAWLLTAQKAQKHPSIIITEV